MNILFFLAKRKPGKTMLGRSLCDIDQKEWNLEMEMNNEQSQ